MKIAKIYKITNTVTGKLYIGFTTSKYISTRWNRHKFNARHSVYNTKLYNSIRKHGESAFILECLYCSKDIEFTLKVMEPLFISIYNTVKEGYNIAPGGEGNLYNVPSAKSQKAFLEAAKKPRTLEERKKMAEAKAKDYVVTLPSGEIQDVRNLKIFCDEHGLLASDMYRVAAGKYKQYFGYTCRKAA